MTCRATAQPSGATRSSICTTGGRCSVPPPPLGQDWRVDERQDMILTGELEPFIVVAADCTDAATNIPAKGR